MRSARTEERTSGSNGRTKKNPTLSRLNDTHATNDSYSFVGALRPIVYNFGAVTFQGRVNMPCCKPKKAAKTKKAKKTTKA
ncbi:MAG: hypothetical protein ACM3JB_05300 [Acidobacteriaceae bacterium]